MKDKFKKPRGIVHIQQFDADGKLIYDETIDNLIVDLGKQKTCLLLTGAVIGNFINQAGCGTSNAATTSGDTTLAGAVNVGISSSTLPTTTSVQFQFVFGSGVANGLTIQEFGLITGDGTLFSRVVWPPIAKTSGSSIYGTWTIEF